MVRHQIERLDMTDRFATPNHDLLFAFIVSGWEKIMPLQEAIEVSDYLGWDNSTLTRKLSGHLVRGDTSPMGEEIKEWLMGHRNLPKPIPRPGV